MASLNVLPTARTVPFTATAMSTCRPPETRPVTQVGMVAPSGSTLAYARGAVSVTLDCDVPADCAFWPISCWLGPIR